MRWPLRFVVHVLCLLRVLGGHFGLSYLAMECTVLLPGRLAAALCAQVQVG